ncbi:hypothetical protein [Aneurinibacillus terranovensis]|uniref:hypothetical protein n=1 Tax=Aneurinibacillus terranovensis TaxID=278991 RepID=UPI00041DBE19|nr:hypothetical protein [Aneurinibacillus terranovensis]
MTDDYKDTYEYRAGYLAGHTEGFKKALQVYIKRLPIADRLEIAEKSFHHLSLKDVVGVCGITWDEVNELANRYPFQIIEECENKRVITNDMDDYQRAYVEGGYEEAKRIVRNGMFSVCTGNDIRLCKAPTKGNQIIDERIH